MDREDFMDIVYSELHSDGDNNLANRIIDAADEYVEYSLAKPPAQPEPCEDAVSRKDCLQALSHLMDVEGFRSGWAVSRANVECMLKAMPSVTPKQRTGKWIRNGWAITCSECGYDMPYTVRNFCPNCGAKLTEGDAE